MKFSLVPKNTSSMERDKRTTSTVSRDIKVLILSKKGKPKGAKDGWTCLESTENLNLNSFSHCFMLDDFKIDFNQFQNTHFFYGSNQDPAAFKTLHNPNVTVFWTKGMKESERVLIHSFSHILENEETPAKPLSGRHVHDAEYVQPKEHEREEALKQGLSTYKTHSGRIFFERIRTLSKQDYCTVRTLSALEFDGTEFLRSTLEGKHLSQDESISARDVITPNQIYTGFIKRHEIWKKSRLVQDPKEIFPKNLKIDVSQDGDNFEVFCPIHLMGQARGSHIVIRYYKGGA